MASLLQVGTATFENEVLKAREPVLVDFWATWCTSCKALEPKLEEIASELQGRVRVVKINIEESPEIAQKYAVRGLPSMLVFKGGELRNGLHGNHSKQSITEALEAVL